MDYVGGRRASRRPNDRCPFIPSCAGSIAVLVCGSPTNSGPAAPIAILLSHWYATRRAKSPIFSRGGSGVLVTSLVFAMRGGALPSISEVSQRRPSPPTAVLFVGGSLRGLRYSMGSPCGGAIRLICLGISTENKVYQLVVALAHKLHELPFRFAVKRKSLVKPLYEQKAKLRTKPLPR